MDNNINKLYSVQYINHISGSHEVIGVFRDERIANEFAEDRNKSQSIKSEPKGTYVVHPLYTDF